MEKVKHKFVLPKCGDAQRLIETLAWEVQYLWQRVNELEDRLEAKLDKEPDVAPFNRAAL